MRILITGISGFIGSAVYTKFKEKGYDIYSIDNLSFGNRDLIDIIPDNFFVEDIRNRDRVMAIFEKVQPDWVIHLAAIHFIPYCNSHPFEASEVNIQGTKNILGAGSIKLESYSNISSKVAIYSSNDDYSGANMTNPMVPSQFTNVQSESVHIGKHVIVGSGSVVLPGVVIELGVAIGSLSLVNSTCREFGIYAGIPARRIKERSKELLNREDEFTKNS